MRMLRFDADIICPDIQMPSPISMCMDCECFRGLDEASGVIGFAVYCTYGEDKNKGELGNVP